MMSNMIALGVGSLAGGLSRYFLTGAVQKASGTVFPWGTMAVNLLGCFLIGILNALARDKFLMGPEARLLLMTGFCGAFTTFSTFLFETSELMKDGQVSRALLNVLLSLTAGLVLLRLGELFGRAV